MTALVLVAHGSRDPRAAASTRALVRAVAAARPGLDVRAAFLDHTAPTPRAVLAALAADGCAEAVAVPLLLTEAYHGRVDIPSMLAEVRAAGVPIEVHRAPVLGPAAGAPVDAALIEALVRRLAEARLRHDALVLAAAGTRDATARSTVDAAAAALGTALGVRCLAAYASAAAPTPGDAVRLLRAGGATRVAVASYFLAPGLLHDRALASAASAGAVGASAPLGDVPAVARLVLDRASVAALTMSATTHREVSRRAAVRRPAAQAT